MTGIGSQDQQGVVVRTTRRHAVVRTAENLELPARLLAKVTELAAGDHVRYRPQGRDTVITAVSPRKNCLYRTYRDCRKELAANLDHLFIVTAVAPLFNPSFIDRVLVFCELQQIPVSLIVNKIDLGLEATQAGIGLYHALGGQVLYTSAADGTGIAALVERLTRPELEIAALAGVSGVGKSSLLNRLIPEARVKIAETTLKTGQGRRTTSQACAYPYPRSDAKELLLIDLPGVQAFGVAGLTERELAAGFPEIAAHRHACEYLDCFHLAEPHCAVKDGLAAGAIAPSRYASYTAMLDEIRAAKPY